MNTDKSRPYFFSSCFNTVNKTLYLIPCFNWNGARVMFVTCWFFFRGCMISFAGYVAQWTNLFTETPKDAYLEKSLFLKVYVTYLGTISEKQPSTGKWYNEYFDSLVFGSEQPKAAHSQGRHIANFVSTGLSLLAHFQFSSRLAALTLTRIVSNDCGCIPEEGEDVVRPPTRLLCSRR